MHSDWLPAINLAAEDDRCGGFFDAIHAANQVEQLIQLFWGISTQPGHVIELATDRAQLLNLGHRTQAPQHFLA